MRYVGVKEVLKAVRNNDVSKVYVGKDAETHVLAELITSCNEMNIEIVEVETMQKLGEMAGIEVKAATAAE